MVSARTKACGVDGLQRENLLEGMISGDDPLSYVHLTLGAAERLGIESGAGGNSGRANDLGVVSH